MDDSYTSFATVYDELMDNIPYEEWFHYLHGLLSEYNIDDGIIAELGCGTGNITEQLSAAGYEMIGIDNSPAMLEVANRKKEQNNSNTLYLCQDMRDFELYGTVKAIISLCDSVNYIAEPDELLQVFTLCNNYLDTGGLMIFDFHTKHYYEEIADTTIAENRDDVSFIWDNLYDDEENINELLLTLFFRVNDESGDDLYRKYEEVHVQRGYTLNEITTLVKESGMELIAAYDAFTHTPATEDNDRIYIIAREHTVSGAKKAFADNYNKED